MSLRSFGWIFVTVAAVAATAVPAGSAWADHEWHEYCDLGIPADERLELNWLPRGDVFCPLIADPKSEGTFASYLRGTSESAFGTDVASVGVGDKFGIFRHNGPTLGEGVQLSLAGNIYAQFDLNQPSYDLINADYVVGLHLTYRRGPFSSRLRLYHQSSHLGDEFLLRGDTTIVRENFAFESFDGLLSMEFGPIRVYAGGEGLFNREPEDIISSVAHGGIEFRQRSGFPVGETTRLAWVAGGDVKAADQLDWDLSISARAGFEIRRVAGAEHRTRRFSVLAEFYDGRSPYGQFFEESVRYYGAGFHMGL